MKAILRKSKIRVASELPEAVKTALKTISTNGLQRVVSRMWHLR